MKFNFKFNFRPKKFMRTTEDSFFSQEHHVLIDTAAKAENVCKYDLDDLDSEWLKVFNDRRYDLGKKDLFHFKENKLFLMCIIF